MKNINTHCFRTVGDAGPYGFSGYRQFLRSRQGTAKPQFVGITRIAMWGMTEKLRKSIDKQRIRRYNNIRGVTDVGCFLVAMKKDNRLVGSAAVIFFYYEYQ